jgi:S1-C subfamily serine protease
MSKSIALRFVLVACLGPSPVWAQAALEQLEGQLQNPAPPLRANNPQNGQPGTPEPGYLGVIADDQKDGGTGVRIVEVVQGAPAGIGGLQAGDLVTAINNRPVQTMQDFEPIMTASPPAAQLAFQIQRGGKPQTVNVTLGARPPAGARRFEQFGQIPAGPGGERPTGLLGINMATVTPEVQRVLGLPSARGVLVVGVVDGSPAQKAGIPVQAVIMSVDGKGVETTADLARLIAEAGPGKEVAIGYFLQGATFERKVLLQPYTVGVPTGPPLAMPASPQPVDNSSAPSSSADERVLILEQRVKALEQRLEVLEKAVGVAAGSLPSPALPPPQNAPK